MLSLAVALTVACFTAMVMACFVLAIDTIWRAKQRQQENALPCEGLSSRLGAGSIGP
jgi:hypothetical protein